MERPRTPTLGILAALSYLAVLVLAFVGADASDSRPPSFEPWEREAQCLLWPEDYSQQWYRWESCSVTGDRPITKVEAQSILDEVWEAWLPWLRGRVGGAFEPPKPTLNFGQRNLDRYCGGNVAGCFGTRSYEPSRATRIVVAWPRLTLRTLLHEIAHATNFYADWLPGVRAGAWGRSLPSVRTAPYGDFEAAAHAERIVRTREQHRTKSHGLDFRCQALLLYHDYGLVADDVFAVLDPVCEAAAPLSSRSARDTLSFPAGQWCSAHPAPFSDQWAERLAEADAKRPTCTMTGGNPLGESSSSTSVWLSEGRWRITGTVTSEQPNHGAYSRLFPESFGFTLDRRGCSTRLTGWPADSAVLNIHPESDWCWPGRYHVQVNTSGKWTLSFEPESS